MPDNCSLYLSPFLPTFPSLSILLVTSPFPVSPSLHPRQISYLHFSPPSSLTISFQSVCTLFLSHISCHLSCLHSPLPLFLLCLSPFRYIRALFPSSILHSIHLEPYPSFTSLPSSNVFTLPPPSYRPSVLSTLTLSFLRPSPYAFHSACTQVYILRGFSLIL